MYISKLFTLDYRRISSTNLITDTEEMPAANEETTTAQLDQDIVPVPFDLDKELSHIKAHRQNDREQTKRTNMCCIY